ncbi:MAG: type transport system permease protein [Solirubrobacterales bacterium]|nr:type transport system permease protein [Solirubrobacterales bacterium]
MSEARTPGLRTVALAVAWRSIHNYLTNPAFLVPSLVFPLFFFVSFAGGLSAIANVPGFDFPTGYTAFQFVFVLLQSAAFGGVFTGFGIARDFETGFARRYLLAAGNRGGIIAGYAIAALVRAAITWGVLTTVALVAGMNIDGGGIDIFGLYALAILVNLAATMWAAGVAMRVRSIQGGPLMQFPVFLILFLTPVYVPLSLLSGWIHAVASVNPVTALLEAGRGFISGDPTVIALAFAIGATLPILFGLWARGGLRRAEAAG